jgi:hypothetical protein
MDMLQDYSDHLEKAGMMNLLESREHALVVDHIARL